MRLISKLTIVLLLPLLSSLVTGGNASATGTTSPGKNSAFASASAVALDGATPLTAQILKGKPKRVLKIDITVHASPSVTGDADGFDIQAQVSVNGILFPEPLSTLGQTCNNTLATNLAPFCQLSGTLWLDLDAAEAANPGMVKGKPLNVEMLTVGIALDAGIPRVGSVSLSVQMVKK